MRLERPKSRRGRAVIPERFTVSLRASLVSPVYDRVEAPATPEQKEMLGKLSAPQVRSTELAGEKIQTILTHAPGQRRFHRRIEGGHRERMVRCASVRDGEYLQNLCGKLPRRRPSMPHPGGSAEHRERRPRSGA